jgi:hypothetical protein
LAGKQKYRDHRQDLDIIRVVVVVGNMDLNKIGYGGVDWIHVVQERDLERFCSMQLVSYLASWVDNYIALHIAEKQNIYIYTDFSFCNLLEMSCQNRNSCELYVKQQSTLTVCLL